MSSATSSVYGLVHNQLRRIHQHHLTKRRSRLSETSVMTTTNRPPVTFLQWYTLFVEALEFCDLETLINCQFTCRHVLLLMAQHQVFKRFFFSSKLQPFPRKLLLPTATAALSSSLPSPRRPVAHITWTSDELTGSEDHPDISDDEVAARRLLCDSSAPSLISLEQSHPASSWKCVARRYQRQTEGVACRVSTPEYFRGVWRISERSIWSRDHLSIISSPPFFLQPRSRRRNFLTLRQSKFPEGEILKQQQFQVVLQRTNRGGSNALGCFIQVPVPLEGGPDQKLNVIFTLATLDQSLSVDKQYKALSRYTTSAVLDASRANSGTVFQGRAITLSTMLGEERNNRPNTTDEDRNHPSCEDIVVEVEVFSLGPGVVESDDVLTYAEEIASVLNLGVDQVTLPMRVQIWSMLRNLSHTDPYAGGIMAKRKKMLRLLLPSLIRDLSPDADTELCHHCTGVLWNLSDVDFPPVNREKLQEIIQCLLVRNRKLILSEDAEAKEDEALKKFIRQERRTLLGGKKSENGNDDDDEDRDQDHDESALLEDPTQVNERQQQRRHYASLCPSFFGCLWNFPQSISATIDFFVRLAPKQSQQQQEQQDSSSPPPVALLPMIARMIRLELRQEQQIEARQVLFLEKKRHRQQILREERRRDRRLHQQQQQQQRTRDQEQQLRNGETEIGEIQAESGATSTSNLNDVDESSRHTDDNDDVEEETEQEVESFRVRSYENPKSGIVFAACHYLARAIFYLYKKIDSITKVLDEIGAEDLLQQGVSLLRRKTKVAGELGVTLFSRDYAIFFVPLLLVGSENRSSRGCLELASFAFDIGYWTTMEPNDDE